MKELTYEEVMELIKQDKLPDDFDQWGLTKEHNNSWTVAHKLASINKLPDGFNHWNLEDYMGRTVAHIAAKVGKRLTNEFFERTDIPKLLSIAYMAATFNNLPKGFNKWDMSDEDGVTVAHIAACNGNLPDDFDQWELADKTGWTVAHSFANHNAKLSKTFDKCDMSELE
jgi:hypothetical protein